jgi:hypothetical protein
MRQKLCRRLEELEKIRAAVQRARTSSVDRQFLNELKARVEAWHADPVNQEWLAEQPPDFLYHRVQELRRQLLDRACGHSRWVPVGRLG